MNNLTLPTKEQLFGKNKLDIIKKRGTKARVTDFYMLLGGYYDNGHYTDNGNKLKDRFGYYWTKTGDGNNDTGAVSDDGLRYMNFVNERSAGARPTLPYSSISNNSSNVVKERGRDGLLEIEYGYYPQYAPSSAFQMFLEYCYKGGNLNKTGNTYTTDSRKYNEYTRSFQAQVHEEYECIGKRYIRVIANSSFDGNQFTLSNGEVYKDGDAVWLEVEPVKWLVDEEQDVMLTENIIFAGVQFSNERNYKTSNFHKTDIYWFMNTYLIKELFRNNNTNINNIIDNTNHKTTEQLLEEIKTLRIQLEQALNKNKELEKENNNYKQRIRRIQDITKE